ncbi:MAG: hypothetical protein ACQEQ4_09565, partial [Fibrobacterota bacterium]
VGAGWILVFGVTAAVFGFSPHVGMMLVVLAGERGTEEGSAKIIWRITRRFPRLISLTFLQVAGHGILTVPPMGILAMLFTHFSGGYDVYYVIRTHPRELWFFCRSICTLCNWAGYQFLVVS